jgi:hypothetical protein
MFFSFGYVRRSFGVLIVVLLNVFIPLSGMSLEGNEEAGSESERKCAQNAVYAVSKILDHDVDWFQIDAEFGGEGDVPLLISQQEDI